jgi:antitoxin HigA-1
VSRSWVYHRAEAGLLPHLRVGGLLRFDPDVVRAFARNGEILLEEFLEPMGLPQLQLAANLGVTVQRINEIVRGKRGITPETAWMFAGAFGTTPEFWMNLQTHYDLARNRPERKIARIKSAR